ncbi:MAG TPA: alpha/beta hydrolase [Gemmatimonadaceae bacterium]|nr:alpha/beta hydrolase [Gemmatimonadaceae bacterium]
MSASCCPAVRRSAILSLLAVTGCATGLRELKPNEEPIVRQAIFIHPNGTPIEPRVGQSGRQFVSDTAYGQYLSRIMQAIRADSVRRDGKHKILLRIHGGLNTLTSALDASVAMADSIRADANSGYFPIFVNWESGLLSSLGEHLFNTRRGEYHPARSLAGAPLAPVYLVSDLGQGIVRAPLTSVRQLRNYFTATFENSQPPFPDLEHPATLGVVDTTKKSKPIDIAQKREQTLAVQQQPLGTDARGRRGMASPANELTVSRFTYSRSKKEAYFHVGAALAYSIPPNLYVMGYRQVVQGRSTSRLTPTWAAVLGWIPLKPFAMYIVDALGTPAWITMHRRSQAMFEDPNAFGHRQNAPPGYIPPSGAFSHFLDSLESLIRRDTATKYELTVIGHSMGAIVATELARRRDSLPIDNLVFMASAASLREFEIGVVPYLERHDSTQFYDLTLHPLADLREKHLFRLAPYGSLLEWIDSYYSRPENDFDRMMGKYNNVVQASFMFPSSIRGRVHIKGFGYNDGSGCGPTKNLPYEHGQFNDLSVPFWRPQFWHPNQIGCEAVKAAPVAP